MSNTIIGIGGAPTRASIISKDAATRKKQPVASGVLDYFPDALVAIAEVSYAGNQQHNPDQPLFWNREKSGDESDALIRHFLQRGTMDDDGIRHSAKMAWRALGLLQKEIEAERESAQAEDKSEYRTEFYKHPDGSESYRLWRGDKLISSVPVQKFPLQEL